MGCIVYGAVWMYGCMGLYGAVWMYSPAGQPGQGEAHVWAVIQRHTASYISFSYSKLYTLYTFFVHTPYTAFALVPMSWNVAGAEPDLEEAELRLRRALEVSFQHPFAAVRGNRRRPVVRVDMSAC